jgi:hypothetical protein
MSLTKFTFIIPINGEGKERLIRLDTLEEIPKQNIHMVKQPPIILNFEHGSTLPLYIKMKKGFREKSNSLLVGEKLEERDCDYYSVSYCKI